MNKNHTETEVSKIPWCDICTKKPAVYDAKTRISRLKLGAWGYMCQECFDEFGVGLGEGKGQKLILVRPYKMYALDQNADERWGGTISASSKQKAAQLAIVQIWITENDRRIELHFENEPEPIDDDKSYQEQISRAEYREPADMPPDDEPVLPITGIEISFDEDL